MKCARCFAAVLFTVLLLLCTQAKTQSLNEGTVSGSGIVTVKQKPTRLRMSIQFVEEASTLEEALAKLQDRIKAAKLQLESMDVARDSLKTSDPTLVEKSEQQKQMEQMMRQQLAMQGRRIPKGLETPKIVKIGSTLTAEWSLPTDSHEKALLLVSNVQQQVTAADLAGLNEPKELSAAEEELAEEMEEMMGYSYGEQQAKPGEPQFFYVGTITEEQRQEALKSAFAKAKAQAAELADAAGASLGRLTEISGSTTPTEDSGYGYAMMMQMWAQSGMTPAQPQEHEAIAAKPDAVGFQITVSAQFALQD